MKGTKYLVLTAIVLTLVLATAAYALADSDKLKANKTDKHDSSDELESEDTTYDQAVSELRTLSPVKLYENMTESLYIKQVLGPIFIGDGFIVSSDNSKAEPIRITLTKARIITASELKELKKKYTNKTEFNEQLRLLSQNWTSKVYARLVVGKGEDQRHYILRVKESTNNTAIFYVLPIPSDKDELNAIEQDVNASIGTLEITRLKFDNIEIWKDARLVINEGLYNGTWSLTAYSFKPWIKAYSTGEKLSNGLEKNLEKKGEIPGKKVGWWNKILNFRANKSNNSKANNSQENNSHENNSNEED